MTRRRAPARTSHTVEEAAHPPVADRPAAHPAGVPLPTLEVSLPRPPEQPSAPSFPLLATLAPVLGALGLWAFTQTATVLLFAVLGPVVAVGSLVDSRIRGRRTRRRERRRFAAELASTEERLRAAQQRQRAFLARAVRSSAALLAAPPRDPERWRHGGGPLPVVIGRGPVASGIRLTEAVGVTSSDAVEPEGGQLSELRMRAAVLPDAPVIVDAAAGVGVWGPMVEARALARGILVQLAAALSPQTVSLRAMAAPLGRGGADAAAGPGELWLSRLPHQMALVDRGVESRAGGESIPHEAAAEWAEFTIAGAAGLDRVVVAWAESAEALPRDCRLLLAVSGGRVTLPRSPEEGAAAPAALATEGTPVGMCPVTARAEFVTAAQAGAFAAVLAAAAVAEGWAASRAEPPDTLDFAGLPAPANPTTEPGVGLPAVFTADGRGPLTLDLVRQGPHAIVGGTTGSGKSELLIAWVLGMAAAHPPEQVTFLLVDFKGGSSFGTVENLPHAVGLLTDLDQATAQRALESLRAELRYREHRLAAQGARSIEELSGEGALPRLVVVVDEFAAMVADFPELHALFGDIAARGRSLGVHLILCTQRPGGVLRDAVLANCTLRLSLRVNNAADSLAVIGTTQAAELPPDRLGRAWLSLAGGAPRAVQVALAGPSDIAAVTAAHVGAPPPRRPWLPPLPAVVTMAKVRERMAAAEEAEAVSGARYFGLFDQPEHQAQPPACWHPLADGNLLVLGGRGSGKSGLLATLAAAGPGTVWLPAEVEGAWDLLARLAAGDIPASWRVLVIDDLDSLLARFSEAHQPLVIERLAGLLRGAATAEGSPSPLRLALTAQRLTPGMQGLASLCDARMLLRLPSRQDHAMAGGDGVSYEQRMPPGGAFWSGHRAQIAWVAEEERGRVDDECEYAVCATRRPLDPGTGPGLLVVTRRPAALAALLTEAAPRATVTTPAGAGAMRARLAGTGMNTAEPRTPGLEIVDPAISEQAPPLLIVADPQDWQSQWGLLGALRGQLPLLFDRCTPAEVRAVIGRPLLPPPLGDRPGGAWLLGPEGEIERVQLPEGPSTRAAPGVASLPRRLGE